MQNKRGKAIATVAALATFGIGAAIGASAASGNTGTPATVTRNVPGPTVTVTAPAPAPVTVTPTPTQPASGTVLGTWSGSGNAVTPPFTIPDSGNYIVSWQYSGNIDPSVGGGTNFSIQNTNSSALSTSLPNDIASSGHGSTEVTGGQGTESFNVQSASGCQWTITVKTAP